MWPASLFTSVKCHNLDDIFPPSLMVMVFKRRRKLTFLIEYCQTFMVLAGGFHMHWRKYFAYLKHEVLCNGTGHSIWWKTTNNSFISDFRVRFAMKGFVVKILLSLLFIALVTSSIVAESRLHKEYKSGKKTRKWYICLFLPPEACVDHKNTIYWLSYFKTRPVFTIRKKPTKDELPKFLELKIVFSFIGSASLKCITEVCNLLLKNTTWKNRSVLKETSLVQRTLWQTLHSYM